ncbi:uncharacterized protein TM35_000192820 [Trypanosoma theileri]|uniref:Uncharacterized protein n=1 Tax=Trypanosoma theileri TaxID=67003 RepID=A0A1X0NU19_9TRYP|nr:uncharacterized protein TM35_000192820 [Trypanosoma theileri]ORC88038.1 hypothetical protein TM35_000192820 [Trypanosoma theileri]
MTENPSSLQLDDNILEALVHTLANDRRIRVSACLPQILNDVANSQSDVVSSRRGERKGRWEHARATALAEMLQRILKNNTRAEEWCHVEGEWNTFMRDLDSGRRQNSGEQRALKALVEPAIEALSPLLTFLPCSEKVVEEKLQWARGFYARAVFSLLRVHLHGVAETEFIIWLRRYEWNVELSTLLQPFMKSEVEPLEKELAFHFQDGKKTARRDQPQHFFSFLLQMYEQYTMNTSTHGWTLVTTMGHDVLNLVALGSVRLASTAASVFCNAYDWFEGSAFLAEKDFTVHVVNSFIDFLSRAEGRIHKSSQLLLADIILFPTAFHIFLDSARVTAEKSFATGSRVLWRLEFLAVETPDAFNTYCGTHHMLRCLEAIVRRLSVVFTLLPSYAVSLWERTIIPSLSSFLCMLDSAVVVDTAMPLGGILLSVELLNCVHVMHAVAEEWVERLRDVAAAAATLEHITQWEGEHTHRTSHRITAWITQQMRGPHRTVGDVHTLNTLLHTLAQGRTTAHAMVSEEVKQCLARLTTEEERRQLREYCTAVGMESVAAVLLQITA